VTVTSKNYRLLGVCTLISSLYGAALPTLAETTSMHVSIVGKRVLYQAQYFQRYAPQTASDMVTQVPGFTLVGADGNNNDDEVRGLGQGNGNLLLNGKRASTKDSSPLELLSRIPAENITRIEILTQGSTELAGQSGQIVNVVYKESDQIAGTWGATAHTTEEGVTNLILESSVAGKVNAFGYTANIKRYGDEFPQAGLENAYDGDGQLWQVRSEYTSFFNHGVDLALGLSWGNDTHSANLNLSASTEDAKFYSVSDQYDPALEPGRKRISDLVANVSYQSPEEINSFEIGGDYTMPFYQGTLKFIGLSRSTDDQDDSYFASISANEDNYYFNSFSRPEGTENVLRTLYTFQTAEDHTVELAFEGVKNTLDTEAFFEESHGQGFENVDIPGSNVNVSETRAEISAQYSRPLNDRWALQSMVASEYSKLSVAGDTLPRSESFVRYKGFAAVNGDISENALIRARLERSVGQLQFSDFASSTNLDEGTQDGGNTGLVPDQTWRAELAYERKLWDTDIVTLTAFVEQVDDFITYIPLGNGTEGRGNIDQLDTIGLEVSGTFALGKVGIPGAKLDFFGKLKKHEFEDPVTGEELRFRQNSHPAVHYRLTFRQDLPNSAIAWGFKLEDRSDNTQYRLKQISKFGHAFPQSHVFFIEHKDIAGMTLKVEGEDLLGFTWENERIFYEDDRNGAISGRETNRRHSDWVIRASLSGTF